jgi:hypothetical protein
LYHATISNAVKDDLKDQDGNVILTKKEQTIMLAQHLYDLLERYRLDKPKLYALTTYVVNNYDIKEEGDVTIYRAISLDEFKKVGNFFKDLSPESHKFFKKDFLFDKDLNPIQKTLAMTWYVEHCKIIDSAFQLGIKKFKVVDKE